MTKDQERIKSLVEKSNGSEVKMIQYATNMANSIKSIEKISLRAIACALELGLESPVTKIFYNKAQELTHEKIVEVGAKMMEKLDEVTNKNTIYFPTYSAIALWKMELLGQFSDGMWENTRPYDHWQAWSNMKVELGSPRRAHEYSVLKDSYNIGALKPIVGDRMLKFARFGKAVGKDIFNIGDSVDNIIEDFPENGPFILEEWKAEMIKRRYYREAEYYWKGLEQKHIDLYYETAYTNKDMNDDIRAIKKAMKNRIR